ncbi:MAG: MBL fold metallo-hydrolase [Anaerolineales bacterium]|nr:MBL fold metallo-hydrolase [Anaerolineales bacterium]
MTVSVLNCGEMHPPLLAWRVGTACVLHRAENRALLIDTGLETRYYESPAGKQKLFKKIFGVVEDPEYSAVRQIRRLGCRPEDVSDIILTHLHFDHAGGLPDFPNAVVHVHAKELKAARNPGRWIDIAFDRENFRHQPRWETYERITDEWMGLPAIRLPFTTEVYFIPLHGHSAGHCGVALRDGAGWVFQCGDSIPVSAAFGATPAWLNAMVVGPQFRWMPLWIREHPEVRILAGHMWSSDFSRE